MSPSFLFRVRRASKLHPHAQVHVFWGVAGGRAQVGTLTFREDELEAALPLLATIGEVEELTG